MSGVYATGAGMKATARTGVNGTEKDQNRERFMTGKEK